MRLIDELGIEPFEPGMFGNPDPLRHAPCELFGSHSCMRGHRHFQDALHARCRHRLHVPFQKRLERLCRLPLRLLGREFLHSIKYEIELCIHRLLDPQRTVIVKHGDAFGLFYVVFAALIRDGCNEFQDRFLRPTIVPRRQWISSVCDRAFTH